MMKTLVYLIMFMLAPTQTEIRESMLEYQSDQSERSPDAGISSRSSREASAQKRIVNIGIFKR